MQNELINQGITLLIAGMGTVFVFLTALVIIMTLMSRIITRLQSTKEPAGPDGDEVAAITAAVAQHRRKQHKRKNER